MNPTLASMDALLRKLRALGLLAPDQAERFAASGDNDIEPRELAARLVAAGLLTAFQAEQVLAGEGLQLRVGPYVLLDRLGAGGMGHVYKAEHRLLKRVVALKIAPRGSAESEVLARFRREVEAAGRLQHPGIVAAYDAGASRGRLYLSMEYVEGLDLERLVGQSGPLSIELACEVVRQTAEALHYAHERGLVHGDVKPSNLLLAPPGVRVKLLDWGLARLTDGSASTKSDKAPDGELCGTPDFLAPERAGGRPSADVRGDLYSLGCTFYFLLTGQVPYPGGSWTEKLLRHSLDLPAPLNGLRPEVPADLAFIVERLMAREPEDRFANAAAVAAALSHPPSAASAGEEKREEPAVERPAKAVNGVASTRFIGAAVAAILLGVAVAGGTRWLVKPAAEGLAPPIVERPAKPAAERPAKPVAPPIEVHAALVQIVGRSQGFATLAEAIAAAGEGDVVTLHGPGPFVLPPLDCRGKALTIRADSTARPRLEMQPADDPWQALFNTDRPLTLEGLELVLPKEHRSRAAPLICCEGAALHLTNCRLTSGAGAAIEARNPGAVVVRGCRIDAGAVGLSVEVGQGSGCRIRVSESELMVRSSTGAALSVWAPEVRQPTPVELELERTTIQAGRALALRGLPAGLTIAARGNRFQFRTALLSYAGCADRDPWRRGTVWRGADNSYEGPASWLWVEGRPVSAKESAWPR
jgi:hypothetical protein